MLPVCTLLLIFTAVAAVDAADAAGAAGPAALKTFRTEAASRVDPVFGDVSSLRESVDQFLALQEEMEKIRNEFSSAVHETLAQLAPQPGRPAQKVCPTAVGPSFAKALEAGRRFLVLGRRLDVRFRNIRRSGELGDTVGLTPDYRLKAKKVRELYVTLARDYREMKFAFHDQLGAELRHAGCKIPGVTAPTSAGKAGEGLVGEAGSGPDPANPAAWDLDAEDDAPIPPNARELAAARPPKDAPETVAPAAGGPGIWIEIDNSRCAQSSTLFLDGVNIGEIAGQKKVAVRTRAGPHELCVLPTTDSRICGSPGTVRRAYLYEGWRLAVRCEQ
jgi:hypothetical protein